MGALLNYVNTPLTIATGGSFTLAANYNITGAYIQAGSANCLTVSAAASSTLASCHATGSAFTLSTRAIAFSSSGTLTLNGIVVIGGRVAGATTANGAHAIESTSAAGTIDVTNASTVTGGSAASAYGLNNNSTGTVTITSSTVTGGSGGTAIGLNNNSTGTVTITSSTVTGGSSSTSYGIQNFSTGTVTITSSTVTGGSGGTSIGLNNASTGTVTVTSTTLTGGSGSSAYGIQNASTGTIVSTGDITATNSASGLSSDSTAANVKISGSLIGSINGRPAIYAAKYLIDPTPTTAKFRQGKNGTTTYSDFFTADNSFGQAAITDVRFGTVYASGALTGVAYIPAAGSVALGVPVDATIGTATLTEANVRAALGMASANLDTQLSTISTKASEVHAIHGLDIANALTVTPTLRAAGAITQAITGDGTTSTIVTRV
jgi:hypothetical protein